MNKYKILWIDDQYELLSELMERCEVINGFEITECRFAKEGMKTFESHLEEWSAVVLDAKVLMESLNEVPNLSGLRYCRDRINELKPRRYVPMFVFTGQPDLISNEMFENMVDKYYSKGDDDDQLIEDIISAADQQEDTQIIHKHQTVFDAWPESKHDLLRILKVLEKEDWQNNSVLNDIRKIMSDVMDKLYVRGFCSVKHDGSNLAACSYDLGQRYMEEIIPVHVVEILFWRYLHESGKMGAAYRGGSQYDLRNCFPSGREALFGDSQIPSEWIFLLMLRVHFIKVVKRKTNCNIHPAIMQQ